MALGLPRTRLAPIPDTAAVSLAALTSAAVVCFDMAGRATRDALFLAAYSPRWLPSMVIMGSAIALIVGVGAARLIAQTPSPSRLLARLLAGSAVLLVLEWLAAARLPGAVAVAFYLHFTSGTALFVSGFWTVVSERFDPSTARRSIGRIAASGTAGGLFGGLLAGGVASASVTPTMLPVLAVLNLGAAIIVNRLASPPGAHAAPADTESVTLDLRKTGLPRYVHVLLAVVVIGAANETVLDFLFMSHASTAAPTSEALLRLFALFYTAVAVLTVLVQLVVTRRTIEIVGLPGTAATLPAGVLFGAAGTLVVPGLSSAVLARGVEMVLRNSTFRAAYELLFNPMPPRQKRVAKTVVDVTAQRLGRIIGSGIVQAVLLVLPVAYAPVLGGIVVGFALLALTAFRWLARHHHRELERSLVRRAEHIVEVVGRDLLETTAFPVFTDAHAIAAAARSASHGEGPQLSRRAELLSGDRERVVRALTEGPLPAVLVPDVLRLLDWDPAAATAIQALRLVASDVTPALVTALNDDATPAKIRRRVVLVLAECPTLAARDGILLALDDERFEVRYRASQALRRLTRQTPELAPRRDRILPIIQSELNHGLSLVAGRHAVALLPEDEADRGLLGEVLLERRDQVLEHVFALLSLCYPDEPLAIALRGLRSDDDHLRASALDYLESTLPMELRRRLWRMFAAATPSRDSGSAPARQAIQELLASRHSIEIRVDELREQLRALELDQGGPDDRPAADPEF